MRPANVYRIFIYLLIDFSRFFSAIGSRAIGAYRLVIRDVSIWPTLSNGCYSFRTSVIAGYFIRFLVYKASHWEISRSFNRMGADQQTPLASLCESFALIAQLASSLSLSFTETRECCGLATRTRGV